MSFLKRLNSPRVWLGSFVAGCLMLVAPDAWAAETIILKYSVFKAPVSVPELSEFVKTGELSPSLFAYLKLANRNPDELRRVLNHRVDVDGRVLSQVLNIYPGELLLDELTEVIHSPTERSSRQALRTALVTSAADDDVRLIEVLENYPTSEIHVEGDRLADIYRQIDSVVGSLPKLPF